MWFRIIIIAAIIGAIIGAANSDKGEVGSGAADGAIGGCLMAISCLGRIAIIGISIIVVLWLCGLIFG